MTEWKYGDLPEKIAVSEHHGVPVDAYPGLKAVAAGVAVRLFATPEEAATATREGLRKLFEIQLRFDLGWLEKDLKALRMLGTLAVTLITPEAMQADALTSIRRWVCDPERMRGKLSRGDESRSPEQFPLAPYLLTKVIFERELAQAKQDLRGLVPKLSDWLKEIFTLRLALETQRPAYPGLADDLAALLPPEFLRSMPFSRLQQVSRDLRGMQARTERWKRDAVKDAQRRQELAPFVAAARRISGRSRGARVGLVAVAPMAAEAADNFRWLVEEFRISLFAQELGTAEPVSAVRLTRVLAELGGSLTEDQASGSARPAPAQTLKPAPATSGKKGAPLKSLGSLDQLFRK